jgi:hypothetical protein
LIINTNSHFIFRFPFFFMCIYADLHLILWPWR